MKPCRSNMLSRCGSRSGFTLVEILVVIAIIALLAGVALPAITGALKKAKENAAVQTAHGLSLAEFQYATDNNGTYPGVNAANTTFTNASAVFQKELYPTYINTTDGLYVAGGACTSKWSGTGTLAAANNAWALVFRDASYTGLTTNDPDNLPTLCTTGYTVTFPTTIGTPAPVVGSAPSTTTAPFGSDGLAVSYKDMSSAFVNGTSNGNATAGNYNMTSANFLPQSTTYTLENP